jgi:TonB-linked SusC/RagA family outer membrane protein
MRKITILLTFLFFIGTIGAFAQEARTVSGKVTSSEDGSGIPGVSVFVKGTTIGTVTDLDGNFSLDIEPTHKTLVFQYVGMETQELEIGQLSSFNVVLSPDAILMEEVVVTALGISREKKSLGYAVQELDGDAVNEVKDVNFVNSLSGKSAGVDILQANTMGGSANVLIRGTTSLTQNNQAMFVIDGVPFNNRNTNEDRPVANSTATNQNDGWGGYDYGNNAMDINTDDIESISVLKGAAATALYGSRAANGVILITTKKGKLAASGKKRIGVTWSGGVNITSADMSTAPHYQDQYGGGYGPFYDNEGVPGADDYYFFYADVDGDGDKELITPTPEDASWGHKFDPNLNVVQWDNLDPLNPDKFAVERPWVAGENALEYWFKEGVQWTNNLSFDAANDKGAMRFSYANFDQTGIVANSRIMRHNLNFQGSYNFTDKLSIETNVSYSNMNAYGRYGTGYDGMNPMQQLGQWFQRNVDLQRLEENWLRPNGEQLSWNSSYYDDLHPIYADNPYWTRNRNYEDDGRDRVFGYVLGKYDFTDYLTFTARFSTDVYTTNQNERIAVSSVDPSYFSNFTQTYQELNTELMLRFNKSWDKFSLSALVGGNFRSNEWETVLGQTVGGLVVPGLYTVSNSVSPSRVTETNIKTAENSAFASASLGVMNFFYLDVTARNDWSSTLKSPTKEDPNAEISYFYPSVSASFLLTELNGLNDVSWLSLLKVRGNYAEVGNDAAAYATQSTYSQNTSWGNYALFSVNSTLQNPDLVPERTKGWEIGLEARFFNNRLGLDYAYYTTNSYDQILPVLVSPFTGVTRMWVNGGQIENKGHEITLLTTPVQTKDWRLDVNVNWWRNRNKVIELFEGVDNLLIYSAWDVSINATVGQPYGTIRGTDFVYTDDNGNITDKDNGKKTVDENGYYLRTANDTVIGNIEPDWKMGIPTTLSWKGLSLYFLVDIQKGGDIYSVSTKYGQATGLYAETAENNDKGVPMRDPVEDGGGYLFPETVNEDGSANTTYVPAFRWGRAFYYNNSPTARYVFDASYVKLREVSLSYSLPKKTIENSILNEVRFSLVGRNLWIIHKNTEHFDPEASLGSGNQQGIESGSYPAMRTFGFNVTLGF